MSKKSGQKAQHRESAPRPDNASAHADWRAAIALAILRHPSASTWFKLTIAALCFMVTVTLGLAFRYGVRVGQLEINSQAQSARNAAQAKAAARRAEEEAHARATAEADAKARLAHEENRRKAAEQDAASARARADADYARRLEEERLRADAEARADINRRETAAAKEAAEQEKNKLSERKAREPRHPLQKNQRPVAAGTADSDFNSVAADRLRQRPAGISKGSAGIWENGISNSNESIFDKLKREGGS